MSRHPERNFCERCGKRVSPDGIHTCTPPHKPEQEPKTGDHTTSARPPRQPLTTDDIAAMWKFVITDDDLRALRAEFHELLDALRQWKWAEEHGDDDELANAKKARDAAIAKATGGNDE